jgi:hypothetical protein
MGTCPFDIMQNRICILIVLELLAVTTFDLLVELMIRNLISLQIILYNMFWGSLHIFIIHFADINT